VEHVAPAPASEAVERVAPSSTTPAAPISAHQSAPARPVPTSSPAGSSPNDVRDPAAMLNLGRPLLEGRATAAGLPLRTPGNARPNVGADERSVGVSQPDQVRANLAAFARGVSAASTGTSLSERVAAERAALASRTPSLRAPLTPRPTSPPADTEALAPSSPNDDARAERTH